MKHCHSLHNELLSGDFNTFATIKYKVWKSFAKELTVQYHCSVCYINFFLGMDKYHQEPKDRLTYVSATGLCIFVSFLEDQ